MHQSSRRNGERKKQRGDWVAKSGPNAGGKSAKGGGGNSSGSRTHVNKYANGSRAGEKQAELSLRAARATEPKRDPRRPAWMDF